MRARADRPDNAARRLLEQFIGGGRKRQYRFTPYTTKNIGKSYGLDWVVAKVVDIPGSRSAHRQPRREVIMAALRRPGKYMPHCGTKERARHARASVAA